MKATIIVPPSNDQPPRMPVEGAVITELLDSFGWHVVLLDIAAFNMTTEAVRLETKKEDPDMIVFMINRNQYRFAKQYVTPLRKELPYSLFVASTDLNPSDLLKWLPDINFAFQGTPRTIIKELTSRTQTKNFDGIPTKGTDLPELPRYHPLSTHLEQHARLRGIRVVDLPLILFGQQITPKQAIEAVKMLRLKYAVQGFSLIGDLPLSTEWLAVFLTELEQAELVGAPANLSFTCEIGNPMQLTPAIIRQLIDHGIQVISFKYKEGIRDQITQIIETTMRVGKQCLMQVPLSEDLNPHSYVEIGRILATHHQLPVMLKFADNPDRLNDEAYVDSLSNGLYLPKGTSIWKDIQQLALRDMLLNRDADRLERFAKQST